jgi:hypothetical protein
MSVLLVWPVTEFGDVTVRRPAVEIASLASGDLNGLGDLAQSLGCGLGDGGQIAAAAPSAC